MIDNGATFDTFEVTDWYDCSRPETLLKANRVCLRQMATDHDGGTDRAVVVKPVDIGEDVTIEQSVIGPDVSIDDSADIRKSIIENSIIGRESRPDSVDLDGSIVDDNTEIRHNSQELNGGGRDNVNDIQTPHD